MLGSTAGSVCQAATSALPVHVTAAAGVSTMLCPSSIAACQNTAKPYASGNSIQCCNWSCPPRHGKIMGALELLAAPMTQSSQPQTKGQVLVAAQELHLLRRHPHAGLLAVEPHQQAPCMPAWLLYAERVWLACAGMLGWLTGAFQSALSSGSDCAGSAATRNSKEWSVPLPKHARATRCPLQMCQQVLKPAGISVHKGGWW